MTPRDVGAAIGLISQFVLEVGDSPMGGQHLVAREWDRARQAILNEMGVRAPADTPDHKEQT